ncbi:MAG: hypothetical protein ACMG6S_14305 [Byssovorax sp.]
MSTSAALGWLSRWLLDARAREVLADIHRALFGALALTVWAAGDLHRPLQQSLALAIELGDLLVLERRRAGAGVVRPAPPSEPPPPDLPPIKPRPSEPPPELPPVTPSEPPKIPPVVVGTFIEIELLDEAGQRHRARGSSFVMLCRMAAVSSRRSTASFVSTASIRGRAISSFLTSTAASGERPRPARPREDRRGPCMSPSRAIACRASLSSSPS